MKNIKTYEDFVNEEINWKGVVAGAMSLLATACSNVQIHDKSGKEISTDNYNADGIVQSIYTSKGTTRSYGRGLMRNYPDEITGYKYTILDNNGNQIVVGLKDDLISTGDSVTVSIENGNIELIMKEEDCKDPSKCSPLPNGKEGVNITKYHF